MGLESEVPLMAHWVRYLKASRCLPWALQDAEADLAAIGTGSPLYRWAQYHLGDVYLALGKTARRRWPGKVWSYGRRDHQQAGCCDEVSGQSSDAMSLLKTTTERLARGARLTAALDALGFGAEAQRNGG